MPFDYGDYDYEPPDDGRPEPPPKKRRYACRDRMCGALDCDNCYPGGEDRDEEEEKEKEDETA